MTQIFWTGDRWVSGWLRGTTGLRGLWIDALHHGAGGGGRRRLRPVRVATTDTHGSIQSLICKQCMVNDALRLGGNEGYHTDSGWSWGTIDFGLDSDFGTTRQNYLS